MDQEENPDVTIEQLLSNESASFGVSLTNEDDSSILGSKSDDKYRLGAEIAKGGMGSVLKAKDINIRRKVAMKVMLDRTKASKDQVVRFIEEAQVTGQLEHPNIVPVHELGIDDDGDPFYTMKMIKGVTLKEIVENIREGDKETIDQYPLTRLLNIFLQACNGVSYAHSKGVVHRDLKPENIMVGEYGEVLVVDWGLAKILGKREIGMMTTEGWDLDDVDSLRLDDESNSQMTMVGQALGTPAYMAPEQAEDASSVDEKADIYAMGGVLYNLLTLRNPVVGKSLRGVLINVVQGNIIDPSNFNDSSFKLEKEKASVQLSHLQGGKIPSALTSVTMKALAKNPEDRYATIADLQKDIQAYLEGFATEAEEAGLATQLKLLIMRNKLLFGGGFSASILFSIIIAIAFMNVKQSEAQAVTAKSKAEENALEAEKERDQTQRALSKAEKSNYTNQIALAAQNINSGNIEIAKGLLESTPEKFRHWEWQHLQSQTEFEFLFIMPHGDDVVSVDFNSKSDLILTGSLDKSAKLWNINYKTPLQKVDFDSPVTKVIFSQDDTKFLAVSEGRAEIWKTDTLTRLSIIDSGDKKFTVADFSADGARVFIGTSNNSLKICDTSTGKEIKSIHQPASVSSISVSPNGRFFLTGYSDNRAHKWNAKTYSMMSVFNNEKLGHAQRYVLCSPDSSKLLLEKAIIENNQISLWFGSHNENILEASFLEKELVVAYTTRFIKKWDLATKKSTATINLRALNPSAFQVSPDGSKFLIGSRDNSAYLLNADHLRAPSHQKIDLAQGAYDSSICKDKVLTTDRRNIYIHDINTGEEIYNHNAVTGENVTNDRKMFGFTALDFSRDGKFFAAADGWTLFIHNAKTGEKIKEVKGEKPIISCALSPDGEFILFGIRGKKVILWDLSNNTLLKEFEAYAAYALDFSRDGKIFATGSWDNNLRIYDTKSKKLLRRFEHTRPITAVDFHPDGKTVLMGCVNSDVLLYDIPSGKLIKVLKGHVGHIKSVAFSSDGKRFITGSIDATAKVWDSDTLRELVTLKGHNKDIRYVGFSENHKEIITSSSDGSVRIWKSE